MSEANDVNALVRRDYQRVEIDYECGMYGAVCREFDDPEKFGYVIAYVPQGLHQEVNKILDLIDREYDRKVPEGRHGIKRPLSAGDVDELILAQYDDTYA